MRRPWSALGRSATGKSSSSSSNSRVLISMVINVGLPYERSLLKNRERYINKKWSYLCKFGIMLKQSKSYKTEPIFSLFMIRNTQNNVHYKLARVFTEVRTVLYFT